MYRSFSERTGGESRCSRRLQLPEIQAVARGAILVVQIMQTFEYVFETVPVAIGTDGLPVNGAHRACVSERARHGWRLVQVLVPDPSAPPKAYELIFERQQPLVSQAGGVSGG